MPQDLSQVKCLFFDVFGTCVDWRTSVTEALQSSAKEALDSSTSSMSDEVRSKASSTTPEQWADFAQQWRNSYLKFTRDLATNPDKAYKTVDEHHLEALRSLLSERGLAILPSNDPTHPVSPESLYTEPQLADLNQIWHRLTPWPDTNSGLSELNKRFRTVTLTNGNLTLITDMVRHGGMPFTDVFSAEMFASYKPSPKVYLGAVEKVGLRPEECALVAAHLDDLKAAVACGLRAVYVERPQEERYPELKGDGFVDLWIGMAEDGFVEVARRLGVS